MSETSAAVDQSRPLRSLRGLALGMTVLVVLQAVLGVVMLSDVKAVEPVHAAIGYALVLCGVLAAIFAFQYSKTSGRKGVFYHALSLPILLLVQIGLAEMKLETIHMVLGIAIAVAIVGLFTMLRPKN